MISPTQPAPLSPARGRWLILLGALLLAEFSPLPARAQNSPTNASPTSIGVGPQYDSTHVYVAPADREAFVKSFLATFGGSATAPVTVNVLPVPSSTESQLVMTPAGMLSVFAFHTPIPYPFGSERTGYLVADMDRAVSAARSAGADVIVQQFTDPIGRDAVIQWPGGLKMQLYWHFKPPSNPPLTTIPENRVYLSPDQADNFVRSFTNFAAGKIVADDAQLDAGEIGRPGEKFRRVRITSIFGNMQVMVTDGHLPYPFGREITGYEVPGLAATLGKAKTAGAKILFGPYSATDRRTALIEFPGGYIAEIHTSIPAHP